MRHQSPARTHTNLYKYLKLNELRCLRNLLMEGILEAEPAIEHITRISRQIGTERTRVLIANIVSLQTELCDLHLEVCDELATRSIRPIRKVIEYARHE